MAVKYMTIEWELPLCTPSLSFLAFVYFMYGITKAALLLFFSLWTLLRVLHGYHYSKSSCLLTQNKWKWREMSCKGAYGDWKVFNITYCCIYGCQRALADGTLSSVFKHFIVQERAMKKSGKSQSQECL